MDLDTDGHQEQKSPEDGRPPYVTQEDDGLPLREAVRPPSKSSDNVSGDQRAAQPLRDVHYVEDESADAIVGVQPGSPDNYCQFVHHDTSLAPGITSSSPMMGNEEYLNHNEGGSFIHDSLTNCPPCISDLTYADLAASMPAMKNISGEETEDNASAHQKAHEKHQNHSQNNDCTTATFLEHSVNQSGSLQATTTRKVPTLTEAELEAYAKEVAVERTASGFYGDDGYYYYYVYKENEDVPLAEGESVVAEVASSLQTIENHRSRARTNKIFISGNSGKLNGYLSLPASLAAQESEAYLASIREWTDIERLEGPISTDGYVELAPDQAGAELRDAHIVDSVRAKAILQYLRNETDRWIKPPLDTVEGVMVANLRIPTYDELRHRLKYEDLQVQEDLQTQTSLSQEWTRIQTEVQMSMASQAERARRASLSQRREPRRSQTLDVNVSQGRRMSNLLFLVPPRNS